MGNLKVILYQVIPNIFMVRRKLSTTLVLWPKKCFVRIRVLYCTYSRIGIVFSGIIRPNYVYHIQSSGELIAGQHIFVNKLTRSGHTVYTV